MHTVPTPCRHLNPWKCDTICTYWEIKCNLLYQDFIANDMKQWFLSGYFVMVAGSEGSSCHMSVCRTYILPLNIMQVYVIKLTLLWNMIIENVTKNETFVSIGVNAPFSSILFSNIDLLEAKNVLKMPLWSFCLLGLSATFTIGHTFCNSRDRDCIQGLHVNFIQLHIPIDDTGMSWSRSSFMVKVK